MTPSAARILALCWRLEFVLLGGNGLFSFLSRYEVGVPGLGSFSKVSSETAHPAAGSGETPAKELHVDLKGPQTLTIPSRSRRQMKICLTSFLYVMLNYLSVAFRAVCSYSMKGHPAHTRCLEG